MSFKFRFKSIEIGWLSQFERKVIPNGWCCDAKGALRCNHLSSWNHKSRPVAGSQRSNKNKNKNKKKNENENENENENKNKNKNLKNKNKNKKQNENNDKQRSILLL